MMPPDDFEAKFDADTLAQAEIIKSDPSRLSRAKQAARDEQKRLSKVAGDDSGDSEMRKGFKRL